MIPAGRSAIALLALTMLASADEAWKTYASRDGVIYQRRAVAGSSFHEYHASTLLPARPQAVLEVIWAGVVDAIPATVAKRVVLARSDDEILIYDQIRTRVVSDRDVTIRIRRVPRTDGAVEIRFDTQNALGPPPDAHHVRIPIVRGAWLLVPVDGGTHLTYECYSEPGGSIPAFIARGAQQDQIIVDVERILGRLRAAR